MRPLGCVQASPASSRPETSQPSQAAAAATPQASVHAPTQAATSTAAPLPAPVAAPSPTVTPFAAGGPVAESPHAPSAPAAPPMPPSQPPQVKSLDPRLFFWTPQKHWSCIHLPLLFMCCRTTMPLSQPVLLYQLASALHRACSCPQMLHAMLRLS